MQAQVRLLEPTRVLDKHGAAVDSTAWRTTKTFDLLRVLALTPGRPIAADTLLDLFWPNVDRARGNTSLRTAACQIRKVLGNDSLVRVGHSLTLTAWTDVGAYRALAAQVDDASSSGQHAKVVALVRQAEQLFAGELELAGTECSVLHEAGRDLRALRVRLLLEGSEAAGRCADWRQSLVFAQHAAAIERSDRSTRTLMRAWFAVGETAKPVEEFERLRRHLADEYGVDPAPQTRALYLEVVSACAEWPPRETTIGRDEEVRQVASAAMAWLMDPEGPTGVVWLVGQPGSGRKTVAREAARTLMLPLADETAVPGNGATVELLPDQGSLSNGLAAMLQLRAATWGRVMLVPVSQVSEAALGENDAVVRIPPMERPDFTRLMALTLQGAPTDRLLDELYEESRGLPGLACRIARRRLGTGDLRWTPGGVGTARGGALLERAFPALATIPFILSSFFGGAVGADAEIRQVAVAELREKSSRHLSSPAGHCGSQQGSTTCLVTVA